MVFLVFRRFVTIRGYPAIIYADNGTQLRAAAKEMKNILQGLDWEKIQVFGVEKGTTWKFVPPDAPWRNGCAESLIRSTKKCLLHAIGNHILSFAEVQTTLYETANVLNERPIGRHPVNPEDGAYLSPNGLQQMYHKALSNSIHLYGNVLNWSKLLWIPFGRK